MLVGRARGSAGTQWVCADQDGLHGIDDPFTAFAEGREPVIAEQPADGELLPPCEPLVVVGIAQNGPGHPSPVQAWLKSPRTVVASGAPVRLRRDAGAAVAEGEIAVIIGRSTAGLTAENAHEYVLGVTAVNDLSSPERTEYDPRNFESKSGEGYTPLGPWIDTEANIDDIPLLVAVDGRTVATTEAGDLPVPIRECLAYVAAWSPLGPGDVVTTGAPFSQTRSEPGHSVSVTVGRVTLTTPFI